MAMQKMYDLHIHCAVGHMRRIDGKLPPIENAGESVPALDWKQPPGNRKYNLRKSQPIFGWWCFYLLDKIVCPYLSKTYGAIWKVKNVRQLEALLDQTVLM